MKKLYTFLAAVYIAASVFAQTPEKMSYQAVIRNSSNQLVTNQLVGMQISILQGSANGTAVYVETQTPNTNANGLISIEIGNGSVVSGNFADINWANGPYFIQTETDPTGGTNYTITGTSQLLSVPYALHAKTAESVTGGIAETDPVYTNSQAVNITATDITNLSNLSGTNSGDQDISGITVNKLAIQDTAAQIRADIPDVSNFISTEADPVFSAWDKDYNDLSNKPTIPTVYNSAVTFTGTAVGSSPQTVRLNQSGNKTITINQADVSGFISTEADPVFTAWDKSTGISITESQISDLDHFTTADETDPIFGASVASGITGTDITNWNNKQDQLVAGTNISIVGNTISATSGSTLAIGQSYQGGIIFWLDDTGQHGLIAATADQSEGITWYNGTYRCTGTTGTGLYAGAMNTALIVATQIADNETGNFAAKVCADYTVTVSGVTYGDWYLPSRYELNLLYQQRNAVGGLASAYYWNSTESGSNFAYGLDLGNGGYINAGKASTFMVRAIRAF